MADMRISELTTAAGLHDGDLFETSQTDSISSSGYASYKTSLSAIAAFIAKQVQFSGDLQTTSKNLIGAINEVFNAGTSVTVTNVLPATETTKRVATITVDGVANDINADDTVNVITDLKTPKSATITNGIAQFECIEENLVKGLKVTMNPIQDLHGQSAPYPAGGGKNKSSVNSVSGVAWAISNADLKNAFNSLQNGTYTISFNIKVKTVTSTGEWIYGFMAQNPDGSISKMNTVTTDATVGDEGSIVQTFAITDSNRGAFTNVNLYGCGAWTTGAKGTADVSNIQIELGNQATQFSPYENICPISGRTEVSVTRTAGEDEETKTHEYSETIYGGVDDFGNGGLDVTHNYIKGTSSNIVRNSGTSWYIQKPSDIKVTGAEQRGVLVSNVFANADIFIHPLGLIRFNTKLEYASVADLLTAIPDIEFVYPKDTPTTISTSAEEITTVAGTNIISGTEPISECKYTELATVDDLIKIIGGQ